MGNKRNYSRRRTATHSDNKVLFLLVCISLFITSVAVVLVVRAYLTSKTNMKDNEFASMTYTNIQIVEPNVRLTIDLTNAPSNDNNGYIAKNAAINNVEGADKKPVYLRATIFSTIYNNKGQNVSLSYPNVKVTWNPNSTLWTKIGDYWYYNRILLPGEATAKLFPYNEQTNDIVVTNAKDLPNGSVVHIDILADAVQAVSTDSVKWKVADYYKTSARTEAIDEVQTAWGRKPTLSTLNPSVSSTLEGVVYDYGNGTWQNLSSEAVDLFLEEQHPLPVSWPTT